MTRAENAQRVADLAAQGLNGLQIAKRLGLSRSYAYELLTDPDGHEVKVRKRLYDEQCTDCGTTIWGTTPTRMTGRCVQCHAAHVRELSRRWILESFAEWEELFGVPPTATDWSPADARAKKMEWKAERHERTGRPWPSVHLVQSNFGSWNAARQAAGFETFEPGRYGRDGEDPAIIAETIALYRRGLSLKQVGQQMHVPWETVRRRLMAANEPRRPRGAPPRKAVAA